MFLKNHVFSLIVGLFLLLGLGSCKSKFEKLRASNNVQMKYQEAVKYYEKEKYSKALTLFQELLAKYRGTADAEDLSYYTAYSAYRLKDYISARFHFKTFADNYPNSQRAEECRFMSAYCYYLDSPRSNLDQDNTRKAIDQLQLFVNLYPESERAKEAGDLIQNLRDKLEKKAFDNAKLYYNMGLPDDYRAAVIALENVLRVYPDTKHAEDIEYLLVKSQYLFADNSYPHRQEERFNQMIDYYDSFTEHFPESKYSSELNGLRGSADRKIAAALKIMANDEKARKQREEDLGISTSNGVPIENNNNNQQ
ncbi:MULTISPECIES: outer membrane protein assembly factor BamD [Sphingobacterium]|uniref:Outer membrane protein assembly factor BamD n=1 Tax=Sphingobacterium cellulitidis TaxID=1768011 RepID=A0A8H9KV46_9SPHI|nr:MULTISPECIES: outer membrane protein assembly factor BamD [Sphingobacterium]MBA8988629.1 outer membrane protein assembly factor BamD [Sphingobacterium soli]OYD41957.1 outer membrane protein assembly factor BamD [Sphingobacterium cellulitidis]OYD44781.1 outer membrane protein assembly factor BamD [Sphingobacterium cellulitidis]WFB63373.1 outer membrane protein assembly factor BamD [Sphingobacterium sp. WM]GGE34376.1 outer membrane protein assembly factor BamD [Sphingobacterium soli]